MFEELEDTEVDNQMYAPFIPSVLLSDVASYDQHERAYLNVCPGMVQPDTKHQYGHTWKQEEFVEHTF